LFNIDVKKTREILINEFAYKPADADHYLSNYPSLDDALIEPVKTWFIDRSILEIELEGITIQQVMQAHKCNFLTAISSINDLFSSPLTIEQKETLKKFLTTPLIRA
jgi:hypothetical protein